MMPAFAGRPEVTICWPRLGRQVTVIGPAEAVLLPFARADE